MPEKVLGPETFGKKICHIVSSCSVFNQQLVGTNFGFHPRHSDFNMPTSLGNVLSYQQLQR